MAKTLRWGIVGCAGIAKRSMIPGIKGSHTGEVTAIASRNQAKAEETARDLDIPKAYGSYEQLLDDPDVDAVYIPLPNHLHKEWTIRAARAGKHVLCEKPAGLNADEVREMTNVCDESGVVFAEAFMYRHHPRYRRIKEIVRSGEIGDIRGIHGTFTFNNAGAKDNVRFKKHMGGGSIYDIGVYPISAARLILEAEPVAATVQAFFSPEHDNVDMMASGLVEFPDHRALTFDCGMWAAFRNTLEILGSEGRIFVPQAFVCKPDRSAAFQVITAEGERTEEVPSVDQYALQADDFAAAVFGERPPLFSPGDAVSNMKVVDACLLSAEKRERVEIR